MISVNLIPHQRLTRKRRGRRLRIWGTFCSAYVIGLIGVFAVCYSMLGRNDLSLTGELQVLKQKTQDSKRLISKLKGELSETQVILETSKTLGNHPDWSTLLVLLINELGETVVLDDCELKPLEANQSGIAADVNTSGSAVRNRPLYQMRYQLKLSGFGRTQPDVSQFVLRLERIKLFDHVKLVKSSRQAFLTGEAVAFQIECSL